MKLQTLSHSDQIVATLAKMPVATFGTQSTKEVMLTLASKFNKRAGWSWYCYVDEIAQAIGRSMRTVRACLRRLEAMGFLQTTHRKDEHKAKWNIQSVYRIGAKLLARFLTPGNGSPSKSFKDFKHRQKNNAVDSFRAKGKEDKRVTADVVYSGVNAEQAVKNVGYLAALKMKLRIA